MNVGSHSPCVLWAGWGTGDRRGGGRDLREGEREGGRWRGMLVRVKECEGESGKWRDGEEMKGKEREMERDVAKGEGMRGREREGFGWG